MSNNTTGASGYPHFPRFSLWNAFHFLTLFLLCNLLFKSDHMPFNTYTVLGISLTIVLVICSLARLMYVFCQRAADRRR